MAAEREEFRASDISKAMELDESTVRKHHLADLVEASLLGNPSPRIYSITAQGERVLAFVEASLSDETEPRWLREGLRIVAIDVQDADYSVIESEVRSTAESLFPSDGDFDLVAVLQDRAAEAKRLMSPRATVGRTSPHQPDWRARRP